MTQSLNLSILFPFALVATLAHADSLPESYLQCVAKSVELCRDDVATMAPAAEACADKLAAGGKLWAAGPAPWVSEMTGRAGGIMMIRALGTQRPADSDVVLFAPEADGRVPESLNDVKAYVVAFGDGTASAQARFSGHAQETNISPTLAQVIPAWIFTGELVAALTRRGKMPVMYETIGAYGGYGRMQKYKSGEVAFHDDLTVPPVAAGVIGNRFADTVAAILRRIEHEERSQLDQVGAWARETKAQGRQRFLYSMGHFIPGEVSTSDIAKAFRTVVWDAGFRKDAPHDTYASGDFAVLIGYQHPPEELLKAARPAGARVAYVSVRNARDYVHDAGVIWIDPMWDWADACVPVDGYDIPILPASGIVNGAITWEIYRLAQQ